MTTKSDWVLVLIVFNPCMPNKFRNKSPLSEKDLLEFWSNVYQRALSAIIK